MLCNPSVSGMGLKISLAFGDRFGTLIWESEPVPMSKPALPPLTFAGREFSSADLELICRITSDFAGLGITEIASTACELLEWKRPSGGLKNLECRRLIEHSAGQGLLRLPERRGRGAPGPLPVARTARGESPAQI